MQKITYRLEGAFREKKLIVFDLDGTLTETKSDMDAEMSWLVARLLAKKTVAVIGGGTYGQFVRQFVRRLRASAALLRNLFLFPTSATACYRHRGGWKNVYVHNLSKKEKTAIARAFQASFREIGYVKPEKTYGKVIEDRGTQVTFSALGQDVVKKLGTRGIELKKQWTREHAKVKIALAQALQRRLPNLSVKVGGFTSVDITRKGIDKAYGIRQIEKQLGIPRKNMLFVGDAIFPGGNDYAVVRTGVDYIRVSGPRETKQVIRGLISPESVL